MESIHWRSEENYCTPYGILGSYRNHRLSIWVKDLKTIQKDVSDKNETLNEKISNLNTAFQVFKANIEKDLASIKNNLGVGSK
jgi:hypothetical protein